jgi:hypothetical protein
MSAFGGKVDITGRIPASAGFLFEKLAPELAPDGAFTLPWPGVLSAPMKGSRYAYLET